MCVMDIAALSETHTPIPSFPVKGEGAGRSHANYFDTR
jgi:hypothetical protein